VIIINLITLKESLLDQIGPEKVMIFREPTINLRAFLVIDNSKYGIPLGDIRIAPELELNEVIRLARAMSLKAASFKIPIGGASAGLVFDPQSEDKNLYIATFGEQIRHLIKEDIFYPEPGLGSKHKDVENIFKISGRPELIPRKIGIFKYDIPLKKKYIGISVSHCLNIIHQNLSKFKIIDNEIKWNDPITILMEGFGRAGREVAKWLKNFRHKVLGISTLEGAIFDEDGLDIDQLLDLKKEHGDNFINYYESENLIELQKEKLFELSTDFPIDFIIPGARPNSINKNNIEKINAKAIIPATTVPYEEEIISELHERKILAFPDFISSSGDILALSTRKKVENNISIEEHIKSKISETTLNLLEKASEKGISPYEFAKNKALDEIRVKIERKKKHIEELKDIIK